MVLNYLMMRLLAMSPILFLLNDATTLDELQERLLDINEQIQSIQATADAEKRDLTEEEATQMDGLFNEFEAVETEINRRKRIQAQTDKLAQSMGRQTDPNPIDDGIDRGGDDVPQNRAAKP